MEETDEADTMMLPKTAEDFSPIVSSTFKEPEPEAKTGEEHDLLGGGLRSCAESLRGVRFGESRGFGASLHNL